MRAGEERRQCVTAATSNTTKSAPPESDLEKSLSDLEALLESLDSADAGSERILLPLDDTAVWLCSKMQALRQWRLAGPSTACVDLALNKLFQTEKAQEAGFNVPKTRVVHTADELLSVSRSEPFPMVLKPLECVSVGQGRVQKCKIWVCANASEVERTIEEWKERVPLLAQPFISGTGEGVFGLATSQQEFGPGARTED